MVTISRTEYETLRDEKAELQQMSMLFDEAEITQPDVEAVERPVPVVAHTRAMKSGAWKDILPAHCTCRGESAPAQRRGASV